MSIEALYANLSCASLDASLPWYEALFGRSPDAAPMEGLREWALGPSGGLQLFENPVDAGRGTLTVLVRGLRAERARLAALSPGEVEEGGPAGIVRLRDPDGNLVVLAALPESAGDGR